MNAALMKHQIQGPRQCLLASQNGYSEELLKVDQILKSETLGKVIEVHAQNKGVEAHHKPGSTRYKEILKRNDALMIQSS